MMSNIAPRVERGRAGVGTGIGLVKSFETDMRRLRQEDRDRCERLKSNQKKMVQYVRHLTSFLNPCEDANETINSVLPVDGCTCRKTATIKVCP